MGCGWGNPNYRIRLEKTQSCCPVPPWRDTSFSGNRYARLTQTLYEMLLVFRAVNSQCDFVSCVLEEARRVGFKPFSLGTSQLHLAELPKDGKQYDMVDGIGVKVRRSGPPFGGDVVVFNIATDRQRCLEISNRPGIARYGFRHKVAPRTPLTG